MKALRSCLGFALVAAGCAGPAAPPPAPEKVVTASTPAPEPTKPAPGKSAPAKPAPAAPAKAPASSPAPAKAAAAAAAPLDLRTLEQRLKDTSAIGVLTKLSLKNQVDDLVARFKAYHAASRPSALTELRPSFDLLLMKVLSLLQDKDAALARDINASREAIWGVLSDKQKLAQFS